MPSTYPDAPASLNGNVLSINRFLNDPVRTQRALRTIAQQRLVSEFLFPRKVDVTGTGQLAYEISEGIYANDNATVVSPLSEYPLTTVGTGTAALATLVKTGVKTHVSDEVIAHNRFDVVQRDTLKMTNSVVKQYDALCLSAASSAVSATQAAIAAWGTATANPWLDILLAKAKVDELNAGFSVDTLFLTPTKWAQAMESLRAMQMLPRETANPIFLGDLREMGGVRFVATTNLPGGTSGLLVDSAQFGGQIWEDLGGDWTGAASDLQYKSERLTRRDGWELGIRFTKLPVVFETQAAIRLTGI